MTKVRPSEFLLSCFASWGQSFPVKEQNIIKFVIGIAQFSSTFAHTTPHPPPHTHIYRVTVNPLQLQQSLLGGGAYFSKIYKIMPSAPLSMEVWWSIRISSFFIWITIIFCLNLQEEFKENLIYILYSIICELFIAQLHFFTGNEAKFVTWAIKRLE